jgi:pilus assembly protein CpaB
VLAIAQEAQRQDESKPKVVNAVTLEVTPEQAEKIDLARNIGTLSLILRNQVDTADSATDGIRRQTLFEKEAPVVAAAPAPAKVAAPVRHAKPKPVAAKPVEESGSTVEVIRGVQKATVDF